MLIMLLQNVATCCDMLSKFLKKLWHVDHVVTKCCNMLWHVVKVSSRSVKVWSRLWEDCKKWSKQGIGILTKSWLFGGPKKCTFSGGAIFAKTWCKRPLETKSAVLEGFANFWNCKNKKPNKYSETALEKMLKMFPYTFSFLSYYPNQNRVVVKKVA